MITILIYFVTTVFIICSILLILAVLMQRPRSEGLGAAFGGGMTDSLFGAQTSDVLVKATVWLGAIFLSCTLALAFLHSYRSRSEFKVSDLLKPEPAAAVEKAPTPPAAPAPAPEAPAAPTPATTPAK
ncbi:MAG: preprotein translocase subunit SecG [Candidatus Methylacidiphilales bacterium]|nr:preprotein translocase subunit SecG [Candidatus Methylacidiphilales bacterium]